MTVNIENIDKTIARIRANKNFKFNMQSWGATERVEMDKDGHFCGTSACIAGFAALANSSVPVTKGTYSYFGKNDELESFEIDVLDLSKVEQTEGVFFLTTSGAFLGLSEDQAAALFLPHAMSLYIESWEATDKSPIGYYNGPKFMAATEDQAIAVLEHLKATGEVNWTKSGIKGDDGFEEAFKVRFSKSFEEYITVRSEEKVTETA
jgi:hypothetical protein